MKSRLKRAAIRSHSTTMLVACVATLSCLVSTPAKAQQSTPPQPRNVFYLDVAEDCNAAYTNPVDPKENTATEVAPGDTIVVGGTIYPGGTLKTGAQKNLPTDPGAIGKWLSRAVFVVNTAQYNGGVSPIAWATMLYMFPDSSASLMSEGLVPNIAHTEQRAVIGGTGIFADAAGQVTHQNLGTNATGCFNYRFTFTLKR
jgi:hypothetical protein